MGKAINTKCKKCGNWYFRRGYCKANGEEISGVDCIHIGGSQAKFCTECGENFAGITHFYENGKEFAKNKSGLCDQIGGKNVYHHPPLFKKNEVNSLIKTSASQ